MVNAKRSGNFGIEDTHTVEIPITALASGGTPPAAVTRAPFRGYAYTIGDSSYFEHTVPKDWEYSGAGTVIAVYVRWACNENYAAANGEVQWRAAYENVDQNNQAIGGGTGANLDSGDVNIPATALQIQETAIGNIPAANLARVDTIGVTLSRIALVGGVNPTAEPEIYAVWFQYTRLISYNTAN